MTSDIIDSLIGNAKELLKQLNDVKTPDITALKSRVNAAIDTAQGSLRDTSKQARDQALRAASTVDDYVHEYPWAAVLATAVAVGAIGFVAGSIAGRKAR